MTDTTLLLRALHFAAEKHRFQRRKGPDASPYINHPIHVADLLARVGGVTDTVTLMAAVLHDTVEDTETTPEELETHFGREVRLVVAEVTDDKTLPSAERKRLQVEHTAHASTRAKLIKLGDKISNVLDVTHHAPSDWSRTRRLDYLTWAEQVVAVCRGTNAPLEAYFDEVLATGRSAIG